MAGHPRENRTSSQGVTALISQPWSAFNGQPAVETMCIQHVADQAESLDRNKLQLYDHLFPSDTLKTVTEVAIY